MRFTLHDNNLLSALFDNVGFIADNWLCCLFLAIIADRVENEEQLFASATWGRRAVPPHTWYRYSR